MGIHHRRNAPNCRFSYHKISFNLSVRGQYKKALPYLQKSLRIYKQYFGEEHEETASTYYSLGILYRSTAVYSLALKYLERGLKIKIRLKGENDAELYTPYFILGTIHLMMGTYDKALSLMLKAKSFFDTYEIDKTLYLANIHSMMWRLIQNKRRL